MISAGLAALPVRGMAKSQNPEMNKKKNTNIFAVRYDTYPEADLPAELGMGFNWFEHLGSGGYYARWDRYPLSTGIYPEIDDDKGWGAIEKGLDELNPGWFRFGTPTDLHINNRGKFDGDTIHFRHLKWLDNWATKNKRTILLDTFLIPRHYEYPLPDGINDPGSTIINMAAANNRKYAENFVAPMIDYVVNELKLKSVRYFNPVNEPMEYGVYQTPDNEPDAMVHYVEMYREIRRALDNIGITRDRVGLIGFDTSFPVKYALHELSRKVDIAPYIDAYSVHHYNLLLDYLPPDSNPDVSRDYFYKGMNITIEQDDKMFLEFARKQNRSFWALEMGTFYYGKFHNPAGVASIDATITVAEGIIRAINTGIQAFCIWSLMNPNDVDGHWAVMGQKNGELIKYKYPFAVYRLISNHFLPGSKVYPVLPGWDSPEIVHVHATFLEAPNGDRTMLLVNDHPDDKQTAEFNLPEDWKDVASFDVSMVNRDILNKAQSRADAINGRIRVECEAFSLLGLKAKARNY
mgnify:CR=1 FL=1